MKPLTPKQRREILLISLRCEYVEINGASLTKKGMGYFTASQWRLIYKIKFFLFPSLKHGLLCFLNDVRRDAEVSKLYPK